MANSVSRTQAEEAVRTLLKWAGDDPDREGLKGTPARVVRAYEEHFRGYKSDPQEYLLKTFEEVGGYDEIVLLKNVSFESHCEHHLEAIIGYVHIGYLPNKRVVGISKLARVVDIFAKRLQIQEKMTAEIACTIDQVLKPLGVAVIIEGIHQCMTTRGVHKSGVTMTTTHFTGLFKDNKDMQLSFLNLLNRPSNL